MASLSHNNIQCYSPVNQKKKSKGLKNERNKNTHQIRARESMKVKLNRTTLAVFLGRSACVCVCALYTILEMIEMNNVVRSVKNVEKVILIVLYGLCHCVHFCDIFFSVCAHN